MGSTVIGETGRDAHRDLPHPGDLYVVAAPPHGERVRRTLCVLA